MSVVTLKAGVQFPILSPAVIRLLSTCDAIARSWPHDLTISSGGEARGRHPSDPHMTGRACDVSVAGLTPGEIAKLHEALKLALGPSFTVLYETPTPPIDTVLHSIATVNPGATAPHIHLQVRIGQTFPSVRDDAA